MKKNPIIFIAMLVALAFTSCQMNTDDSVVIPPAPTTEATSYTVVYGDQTIGTGLTITDVNSCISQFGLVETTDYSINKTTGIITLTASGYEKVEPYLDNGKLPTTPTTPTDSTQWNLDASVIKHENGVGKNDGAFHGTITLNKAKANTGDTVTITVTPDSGYEVGSLSAKGLNGKELEITTVETNKTYTFTVPAYATTVTARFDPVDGYTVNLVDTWNDPFLIKYDGNTSKTFKANENAYFIVMDSYFDAINLNNWTIILDGVDISDCQLYSKENYTFGFPKTECKKVFFKMPVHDVTIEVKKK